MFDTRNVFSFKIIKIGKTAVSALCGIFMTGLVYAAPTGGAITGGTGTINQAGGVTNVNAASQNVVANWATFNVANGETVNFNASQANSRFFNIINDSNRSIINGAINSMGNNASVYLFNNNGITVGSGAQINTTGAFILGGLDAANKALLEANYDSQNFNGVTINMASAGSISVDGASINSAGFQAHTNTDVAISNTSITSDGLNQVKTGATGTASIVNSNLNLSGTTTVDAKTVTVSNSDITSNSGRVAITASDKSTVTNTNLTNVDLTATNSSICLLVSVKTLI